MTSWLIKEMLYLCIHMPGTTKFLFSQLNKSVIEHPFVSLRLPFTKRNRAVAVLTCGCSCRPRGGRWRSRNELLGCCDVPWRPWKSFCSPPAEQLWQKGQSRESQLPSGRPQYLQRMTALRVEEHVKFIHTVDRQHVSVHIPAARGTSGPTTTNPTWWSLQNWARMLWLLTNTSEWRQTLTRVTGRKVCIC